MRVYLHWDDEEKKYIGIYQFQNNGLCRYKILNTPKSKRLSGFSSIMFDLLFAINAVNESIGMKEFETTNRQIDIQTIQKSLLFSMIVSYAKCFTRAEGRGIKLESKDALIYADENLKKFHREVMEMRHNYIAHGGTTAHESTPITAILSPVLENKQLLSVEINGLNLVNDDSRLGAYLTLFQAVYSYVKEKVDLLRKQVEEEALIHGIESLYVNSKLPKIEEAVVTTSRLG